MKTSLPGIKQHTNRLVDPRLSLLSGSAMLRFVQMLILADSLAG